MSLSKPHENPAEANCSIGWKRMMEWKRVRRGKERRKRKGKEREDESVKERELAVRAAPFIHQQHICEDLDYLR